MLATGLCVVCFMRYDWSVYVLIFLACLGRGDAPGGRRWVSVVSSLSMAGDNRSLLCIVFTFVYLSVGFI